MDLGSAVSAATDLAERGVPTRLGWDPSAPSMTPPIINGRCVRSALPLLRKAPFLVSRNSYLTGVNVKFDGGSDFA